MRKITFLLVATAVLLLALAACGGGSTTKITYAVTGTADEANVIYRDQFNEMVRETVRLPWKKIVRVEDGFRYEVTADNNTGQGTVGCTIDVDNEELGQVTGITYAECRGNLQGGVASFRGSFDKAAE